MRVSLSRDKTQYSYGSTVALIVVTSDGAKPREAQLASCDVNNATAIAHRLSELSIFKCIIALENYFSQFVTATLIAFPNKPE